MLRGLEDGPIIAGAYVDHDSGGICPMLAAHRNGGRTDLSSFARAWDCYTGARRPRLATEREVRALRSYLEYSLATEEDLADGSLRKTASRLRAERSRSRREEVVAETVRASRDRTPAQIGDRDRSAELARREGASWIRPTRRYDVFRERVAAAGEQLAEQRAAELARERRLEPV